MKIGKSKQELARIISENGGWRDGAEWAAQDSKMDDYPLRVCLYKNKPKISKSDTGWIDGKFNAIVGDGIEVDKQIPNWHQTILSRAEYFHLYPAPDADGWIEWLRDELPVAKGSVIDVKYSDGDELHAAPCGVFTTNMTSIRGECASAECFGRGDGSFVHIIAYRPHKPEQENPEFCEPVIRSIPEHCNKPTIEQLASDYRNRLDYAERLQREADDAKANADAVLAELVAAGKGIGLEVSPLTEKREPELVITDWRDLRVGDVVFVDSMTCDENEYSIAMVGRECIVVSDGDKYPVCLMNEFTPDGESYWLGGGGDEISWRFIRRP